MQSDVIGIEVWTGDRSSVLEIGARVDYLHPTAYYSINDEGIVDMGHDGYAGGTAWIKYEDVTIHAFMENAIRRVIRGQRDAV